MKTILWVALWAARVSWAADYTVIKDLVGVHPVLEWAGDTAVAGKLTIFAEDSGVGFKTEGVELATHPLASSEVRTPKEPTVLARQENVITQSFNSAEGEVLIQYRLQNGYFEIISHVCRASAPCERSTGVVSLGAAPGETLEAKEFLPTLKGMYGIELAGGQKPKESVNTAEVDAEMDPEETALYVPYCWPSGVCDAGYQPFRYDETRVFRRTLGENHTLITILKGTGDKVSYFAWEDKQGEIVFRNFQYLLDKKNVYLEHVMRKKLTGGGQP